MFDARIVSMYAYVWYVCICEWKRKNQGVFYDPFYMTQSKSVWIRLKKTWKTSIPNKYENVRFDLLILCESVCCCV